MSDLISRQAAIDALLHNQEVYSNNFGTDAIDKYTIAIIDNDVQTIAQLPTAEKVGKWIEVKNKWGGLGIICSECGAQVPRDGWGSAMQSAYCYRCGARMGEEKE